MDSDAWRPFDPVDVKRRVGPGRSAATTGGVSSSRRRTRTTIPTAISRPATANTRGSITLGRMWPWWLSSRSQLMPEHNLLRQPVPTSRGSGIMAPARLGSGARRTAGAG